MRPAKPEGTGPRTGAPTCPAAGPPPRSGLQRSWRRPSHALLRQAIPTQNGLKAAAASSSAQAKPHTEAGSRQREAERNSLRNHARDEPHGRTHDPHTTHHGARDTRAGAAAHGALTGQLAGRCPGSPCTPAAAAQPSGLGDLAADAPGAWGARPRAGRVESQTRTGGPARLCSRSLTHTSLHTSARTTTHSYTRVPTLMPLCSHPPLTRLAASDKVTCAPVRRGQPHQPQTSRTAPRPPPAPRRPRLSGEQQSSSAGRPAGDAASDPGKTHPAGAAEHHPPATWSLERRKIRTSVY